MFKLTHKLIMFIHFMFLVTNLSQAQVLKFLVYLIISYIKVRHLRLLEINKVRHLRLLDIKIYSWKTILGFIVDYSSLVFFCKV